MAVTESADFDEERPVPPARLDAVSSKPAATPKRPSDEVVIQLDLNDVRSRQLERLAAEFVPAQRHLREVYAAAIDPWFSLPFVDSRSNTPTSSEWFKVRWSPS